MTSKYALLKNSRNDPVAIDLKLPSTLSNLYVVYTRLFSL